MVASIRRTCIGAAVLQASAAFAQSGTCSSILSSKATPSVAPGYVARLVATDLSDPRGIKFDSEGSLLVVEAGKGVTALSLEDSGNGCILEKSRKSVVENEDLNHGIEMSDDGSTLYASSAEAVYSWDYDGGSRATTSDSTTLVTNMTNSDHTTRTLLLSQFAPGLMVVTRGSTSNIDALASNLDSGHSQIKAFNLTNMTGPYDFNDDGLLLGWGLRNDVGIDEDPITGAIYSVENSVDEMTRNGQDIHQTNPAEELNFLGYLNGTQSSNQGRNFGYPECYTAWDVDTIPDFDGEVGQQFAIGKLSDSNSDAMCAASERQPPRLSFHPHMAPLDILFNDDGTAAWVTFHGSWNSDPPVGYKLSVIEFANGDPTQPSTSTTSANDIVSNADVTACPDSCFRPVGLAWDRKGRLFMSSDQTGEIYVVLQANGTPTVNATAPSGGSKTGSGSGSSPSSTGVASATGPWGMSVLAVVFAVIAFFI